MLLFLLHLATYSWKCNSRFVCELCKCCLMTKWNSRWIFTDAFFWNYLFRILNMVLQSVLNSSTYKWNQMLNMLDGQLKNRLISFSILLGCDMIYRWHDKMSHCVYFHCIWRCLLRRLTLTLPSIVPFHRMRFVSARAVRMAMRDSPIFSIWSRKLLPFGDSKWCSMFSELSLS